MNENWLSGTHFQKNLILTLHYRSNFREVETKDSPRVAGRLTLGRFRGTLLNMTGGQNTDLQSKDLFQLINI